MKGSGDFDFRGGEILLIDKPIGWSSFDVVRKFRRNMDGAKIGHAGTLDPLATGLMILATGPLTKSISGLQDLTKEYTGEIYLGAVTPSYDRETEPQDFKDTFGITPEAIYKAAAQLTGTIMQVPPVFSAIKIDGKRSYKLARRGKPRELKPRELEIFEFEITDIQMPVVSFRVVCSKGTYIRSLAHDFGQILGTGAYLHSLRRTRVGEYKLEDAWQIDELAEILYRTSKPEPADENIQ